ncbi:MAG TPA: hypothetical protein VK425_05560, partial [Acidimicrobiales bacterium]|nr:hypothetical protein [Acidimicrobiales bacterium]
MKKHRVAPIGTILRALLVIGLSGASTAASQLSIGSPATASARSAAANVFASGLSRTPAASGVGVCRN